MLTRMELRNTYNYKYICLYVSSSVYSLHHIYFYQAVIP